MYSYHTGDPRLDGQLLELERLLERKAEKHIHEHQQWERGQRRSLAVILTIGVSVIAVYLAYIAYEIFGH